MLAWGYCSESLLTAKINTEELWENSTGGIAGEIFWGKFSRGRIHREGGPAGERFHQEGIARNRYGNDPCRNWTKIFWGKLKKFRGSKESNKQHNTKKDIFTKGNKTDIFQLMLTFC